MRSTAGTIRTRYHEYVRRGEGGGGVSGRSVVLWCEIESHENLVLFSSSDFAIDPFSIFFRPIPCTRSQDVCGWGHHLTLGGRGGPRA